MSDIDSLPEEKKAMLAQYLREAVSGEMKKWNAQDAIEALLGQDVELAFVIEHHALIEQSPEIDDLEESMTIDECMDSIKRALEDDGSSGPAVEEKDENDDE